MSRLLVVLCLLLGMFVVAPGAWIESGVGLAVGTAAASEQDEVGNPDGAGEPDGVGRDLDAMVEGLLDQDGIPGATVAVVSDGKVVLRRGYGSADAYGEYPMRTDTVFRTASQAKLFTTVAVLQLAAEGKVDLHADVNRYLDGIRVEDTYPGKPVTLHHLLTHTGGFDHTLTGVATTSSAAADSLAQYVRDHQPRRKTPPGKTMAYDNYGFDLAALVVQQVSGQPYQTYLDRHVFGPLAMEQTTVGPWHRTESTRTSTTGFLSNGQPVSALYSGAIGSGAGPVTNTKDMARFMTALLATDSRLGAEVTDPMRQQQYAEADDVPGMGYGLQHKTWRGTDLLYKGGDLPGQHSAMVLVPEERLGVFVMFHGDGEQGLGGWYPQQVAHHILAREVDGAAEPDQPERKVETDVSAYQGDYRHASTSEDSVLAVSGLIAGVSVRADGPGELLTTGLGGDPTTGERHWVQDAPGHFVSVDGYDEIAFSGGTMASTTGEAETLERASWRDSASTGMLLLGFGGTTLALGWILFGLLALRRFAGKPAHPAGARVARFVAWLAAGTGIGFLVTFVPETMGPEFEQKVMLGSGVFLASKILNTVLLGLIALCVPFAFLAWGRGWWSVLGRGGYSVFVLGGICFLAFAFTHNLIQLPS